MNDRDTLHPLDCGAIAPYLAPFADGEVAEPLRTQVAAHIEGCERCAQRLERIRDIDLLLHRLPQTTPSAGVFERTLAAARRSASDPRAVTREALPGMNGARLRRHLREVIARDVAGEPDAASAATGYAPAAPAGSLAARRKSWIAAAIPAIAALLLISLALTLFTRLPTGPSHGTSSHQPPSASDPLRQTRAAVGAVASQLAFTPVTPGYLPDGASAATVSVGPEQVDAISRYLDITWTFSSGPAQSMHLRETPTGLGFYGYSALAVSPTVPLAWSLPATTGWQALGVSACAACLAVGEAQGNIRLALDAQPRSGASVAASAAWLRLVSLSLDTPYLPLTVSLKAPTDAEALHYLATIADSQGHLWSWDVSVAGATASQQFSRITGAGVDVSEIINNGAAARLDNLTHTYQPLAPPLPSALPPSGVTQPLFAPNAFIAAGELWNLGVRQVTLPDGRALRVNDLYWVNAAQPEHLYADAASGQVIALVVTSPSSVHPGGASGDTNFVSTTACPPYTITYTFITYIAPAQLPARLFDTQQPVGWRQGAVAPGVTCKS